MMMSTRFVTSSLMSNTDWLSGMTPAAFSMKFARRGHEQLGRLEGPFDISAVT